MVESFEGHCEYTRAEFEQEYYQSVLSYLKDKDIKIMVDVGACVGESAKIYDRTLHLDWLFLVEPVKENADFLRGRFLRDDRVKVVNKAMFYGKGEIELHIPLDSVGGATMCEARVSVRTVPTCTLEEFGPEVDFVKLDVEGAELNIIEHSEYLKKVPFIEVEFHHFNGVMNREEFLNLHLPHRVVLNKDGGRFLLEL